MTNPLNARIDIKYWWKCEKLRDIPAALAERLKEAAEDRIFDMLHQGYTSGTLSANIDGVEIEGIEQPEWGWECTGWWSADKT